MTRRARNQAPNDRPSAKRGVTFRTRFDELDRRRARLIERLEHLRAVGHAHPATKRALVLLNQTFRKASLAQRLAILQAADWLIQLIETSLPML